MRKTVKNAMIIPFEKVTLLPDDFPTLDILISVMGIFFTYFDIKLFNFTKNS